MPLQEAVESAWKILEIVSKNNLKDDEIGLRLLKKCLEFILAKINRFS